MNNNELGFLFHADACIQCLGCESACKVWRNVETGVRWRRVENVWHGRYPSVTCSSVSIACLHCVEPDCVSVCAFDALEKGEDGLVRVDHDKCTGCRACLTACAYHVPQFGADGLMQKCDQCADTRGDAMPPCVQSCPTGALELTPMTSDAKSAEQLRTLSLRHPNK